jgi:hypothetical protein
VWGFAPRQRGSGSDDNVTFPNAYGASVRSVALCRYNMKSGTVEDIDIQQKE